MLVILVLQVWRYIFIQRKRKFAFKEIILTVESKTFEKFSSIVAGLTGQICPKWTQQVLYGGGGGGRGQEKKRKGRIHGRNVRWSGCQVPLCDTAQ